MYRLLDKRFYKHSEWSFELREFAIDYIGLSRNYASNVGKIKEKLEPAITELETADFIEPMTREERYTKRGKDWFIKLAKCEAPPPRLEQLWPRWKTRRSCENWLRGV